MEKLITEVINQIKIDLETQDLSAIYELLTTVDKSTLEAYLPEEKNI